MVQTYIGAPVRRREDVRFLTGKATFVDDIKLPYMLHAAILRSTQAHARITAIDASRALAIPGVVAVFTFQDIAPMPSPFPSGSTPWPAWNVFYSTRSRMRRCGTWGNPWRWPLPAVVMWLRMPSMP